MTESTNPLFNNNIETTTDTVIDNKNKVPRKREPSKETKLKLEIKSLVKERNTKERGVELLKEKRAIIEKELVDITAAITEFANTRTIEEINIALEQCKNDLFEELTK